MAAAPVVIVDVNGIEVAAVNHIGEINPELIKTGKR
jgi:hypothetical protein